MNKSEHRFTISNNSKGQVMLLTVLLISGGILSITSITAYLMIQRLHLVSNINDSAKAVYAADAGIEWSLYKLSKPEEAENHPWSLSATKVLGNGAQFTVRTARNEMLYTVSGPDLPGWLMPRCFICDKNSNEPECWDSFISDMPYPDNMCYDWSCLEPGFCPSPFFEVSIPYAATTNITSIGESRNVIRAFELSL